MKLRYSTNLNKPHNWKDFIRDMDLWIMVYDALSYLAKQKIMGVLALKAHVQNSEVAYEKVLNTRELAFFKEILAVKQRDYDPDARLAELRDQVVCIDLHPRSHLIEKYNTKTICGKFLGLNLGKAKTHMLANDNVSYEEQEAAFSFRIAYPDADHMINVSLLDLINLEPFL